MAEQRKYEVVIKEKEGTCKEELFEIMAQNGDIQAIKISELVGMAVSIVGYAKCTITTSDKTFDINYFDTEEYGLISSGSEVFFESVARYFGKIKQCRLTEVKTKKGKTYKAVPSLNNKQQTTNKQEQTTNNDELPF